MQVPEVGFSPRQFMVYMYLVKHLVQACDIMADTGTVRVLQLTISWQSVVGPNVLPVYL